MVNDGKRPMRVLPQTRLSSHRSSEPGGRKNSYVVVEPKMVVTKPREEAKLASEAVSSVPEAGPPYNPMMETALASILEKANRLNLNIDKRLKCDTLIQKVVEKKSVQVDSDVITTKNLKHTTSGLVLSGKKRDKFLHMGVGGVRPMNRPWMSCGNRFMRKHELPNKKQRNESVVVQPPAPPPSPRAPQCSELRLAIGIADRLIDEYKNTDELTSQLLDEAIAINKRMLSYWQRQQDINLVHQIELETNSNAMTLIVNALGNEYDPDDYVETRRRCLKAIAHFEAKTKNQDKQKNVSMASPLTPTEGTERQTGLITWNGENDHHQLFINDYDQRLKVVREIKELEFENNQPMNDLRLQELRLATERKLAFYAMMRVAEEELLSIVMSMSSEDDTDGENEVADPNSMEVLFKEEDIES